MLFEKIISYKSSSIGKLNYKNKFLETPTIFPVHCLGSKGGNNTPLYWKEYPDINNGMFNAVLLKQCPKHRLNKIYLKGLSKYLDIDGCIFVDSGGYIYKKYNTNLTQRDIFNIQNRVKADIASTLDYPISYNKKFDNRNIILSVDNAKEVLTYKNHDMLIYASIHGYDPIIIRNVINHLNKFGNFDGYAIGSLLALSSNYRLLIDMIYAVKKEVDSKPIHVYGLSGPVIIPLLIYLGVDSMDSSSYILAASKKEYFISGSHRRHILDIDVQLKELCSCPVCLKYVKEEVHNSRKLLTYHNIWVIWNEVKNMKIAIKENNVEKYLTKRYENHKWAKKAFRYAKKRYKMRL